MTKTIELGIKVEVESPEGVDVSDASLLGSG